MVAPETFAKTLLKSIVLFTSKVKYRESPAFAYNSLPLTSLSISNESMPIGGVSSTITTRVIVAVLPASSSAV